MRAYDSYEHTLNKSSPLILDYDFVLCEGKYYTFYTFFNLSSKNISKTDSEWLKICENKDKFGGGWRSYNGIDSFFSGQEEEIITNSSVYLVSKIRENNNGILIKIIDVGRGKKYLFAK